MLNKELGLAAAHALYHKDGYWYDELRGFPGILFDYNGYVLFPTKASYESCPELHHPQHARADGRLGTLTVPDRISAIPGYVRDDRIMALH
jgi:hypothetical protein